MASESFTQRKLRDSERENSLKFLSIEGARNMLDQQVMIAQHVQSQADTALRIGLVVATALIAAVPTIANSLGWSFDVVTLTTLPHILAGVLMMFAAIFVIVQTFWSLYQLTSDLYLEPWLNYDDETNDFIVTDTELTGIQRQISEQYSTWIANNQEKLSGKQEDYSRHNNVAFAAWFGALLGFMLIFSVIEEFIFTILTINIIMGVLVVLIPYFVVRFYNSITKHEELYVLSIAIFFIGAVTEVLATVLALV